MSRRDVFRRTIVFEDLQGLADHIARDNLDAAIRFLDAAELTFQRLAESPDLGNPSHFRHPALAGLRRWHVEGFRKHLIFYFVYESEIEIARVLHASRDWEAVLEGGKTY
jgi:toxin ParE1/3/4